MSHIKLTYFDFAGSRGEECRLALCIAGVDFEDHRVDLKDWPSMKASTPFGSLPVIEFEGEGTLAQSNAILTLIGQRHGLLPKNDFQAAKHLAILDAGEELRAEVACTTVFKDPEARKQAREAFAQGYLRQWSGCMEKQILGPFVAGTAISVADIKLYMVTNWFKKGVLDHVPTNVFDDFPKLDALNAAVAAHPNVVAWYAK